MSDASAKFMAAMAEGKVTWLDADVLRPKMTVQFRTPAKPNHIYTCKDFEAAWEQLEELYAQKPPAKEEVTVSDALWEAYQRGDVTRLTYNKDRIPGIALIGWTFRYNGFDYFAETYPALLARFESLVAPTLTLPHEPPAEEEQGDEVPTITLPYQPPGHVWPKKPKMGPWSVPSEEANTNEIKPIDEQINLAPYICCGNTTVYCDCGEELQVDETTNHDEGVTILVRPHACREYSHTAVRRVCDKLAEMLNEHFDATGD